MNFKRKLSRINKSFKLCKNRKILSIPKEAETNCDKLLNYELNCDFLDYEINAEKYRSRLDEYGNKCEFDENLKVRIKTKGAMACAKRKSEVCLGTRNKQKREPLPMKLRAFPQSFWQQPNKTPSVSPGNVYCDSPLLPKEESSPVLSENKEHLEETQSQKNREIVSEPNIDLLFSLFRNVEEEQRKALGQEKSLIIRRGRPKKVKPASKVIRDDDPYLTSSAAESLLPLLYVRNNSKDLQSKIAKNEQVLAMVSVNGTLPNNLTSSANSTNQNYSQILSELVVQL